MRLQHDLHTLTGGYAVDALPPDELDEFERHLTHCGACASEVRGLRETAARLALNVAERPPAQMRDRVLAAAERTRQLPPVTDERRSRTEAHPIRRRVPGRSVHRAHRNWMPRLSVAVTAGVAAVSVALAVIFGVSQNNTSQHLSALENQLSAARVHNQQLDSVLGSNDLHLVSNKTSLGGSVSAIVSPSQAKLVVVTSGLPALPAGKVYELWLLGPSVAQPSGLLTTAERGRTVPVVASGYVKGYKLGITVEPAGGTLKPTTNPIVAMPLST